MFYNKAISCVVRFLRSTRVQEVHSPVGTYRGIVFYSFDNLVADLRDSGFLLICECAEDIIDLASRMKVIADTDPDPGPRVGPEAKLYVLKPVVTSVTAALAHADGSEREVYVVAHNHEVLHREFQLVHPVPDSVATEVHVSGRLEKVELPAFEGDLRDVAVTLRAKRSIGCLRPGIQYHKTNIMSG